MTVKAYGTRRWLSLFLSVASLTIIWCILLPTLGETESVRQHVEFLESRNIDASAMFYTELDAMQPILDHLESR